LCFFFLRSDLALFFTVIFTYHIFVVQKYSFWLFRKQRKRVEILGKIIIYTLCEHLVLLFFFYFFSRLLLLGEEKKERGK
jgi:hypothetical protein